MEAKQLRTATATSAGGVVFRFNNGRIEVALFASNNLSRWGIPKGLVERGESLADAALREVSEETGLTGEIVGEIDRIDYWFVWRPSKVRYHKFVYFYLIRHTGGDMSKHDWEVEEVRWFPIDEAIGQATFKAEKEILEKAKRMIEERMK